MVIQGTIMSIRNLLKFMFLRKTSLIQCATIFWILLGLVWPTFTIAHQFEFVKTLWQTHPEIVIANILARLFETSLLIVLFVVYIKLRKSNTAIKVHESQLERLVTERTEELHKTIHKLEVIASTDHLTKIANRRSLREMLRDEFNRTTRHKNPFSVIMFDIDYFKKVNDTYGHEMGDKVLVAAANAVNQTIRDIDKLGRYGGEEFLIILPETELQKALEIAERARQVIESMSVNGVKVTASFGVTSSVGMPLVTAMLEAADNALYTAKDAGRNNVKSNDAPIKDCTSCTDLVNCMESEFGSEPKPFNS